MMIESIEKNKNKILVIIFLLIFFIGNSVVKDYGVSSDESDQRHSGFVELNYVGKILLPKLTKKISQDKTYIDLHSDRYNEKFSGHLLNSIGGTLEIFFGIDDRRDAFLLRHYMYFFLFFLSLISFYKICMIRFDNWILALIGVFFLLLSPKILAASFYDPKDLPFLSLLIFSVHFGLKFFQTTSLRNAIIFSLVNALVISGIRIYGLISPILILSSFILFLFFTKKINIKKISFIFLVLISTFIFSLILKPYLWENPITNFYNSIKYLGEFGNIWKQQSLFLGQIIYAKDVPWFYSPLWIIITTPIFYIALFFIGILFYFFNFLKNFKINFTQEKFYFDSIFLSIIIIPLAGSIILSGSSYNSWRHLYFIYPYIILFSLLALNKLIKIFNKLIFLRIIYSITILMLLYNFFWIFKNHPHQYVYFNFLAGKNLNEKFDLDYFALSYKENLEYILNNDKREKIYITNNSLNKPVYFLNSLHKNKRERFIFEFTDRDPDYIITNYFLDKIKKNKKISDEKIKNEYEIFNQIIIDNNVINTVFKKKSK